MHPNKKYLGPFCVILAGLIPFFVFSFSYFSSDLLLGELAPLQFDYAEKKWFFSHLRDGVFAWLYPHNQLGHNLATNPASGLLFLPHYLQIFVSAAFAQKFFILFFYGVLFTGVYRLCHRSYVMGLLSVSLALVSCLTDHVALGYFAFYPLAVAEVRRLWETGKGVVIGSLSLSALFLLGDPLLIPAAIGLGVLLSHKREKNNTKGLALACGLVTLIILPHLYAMALDSAQNSRSLGIDPLEALSYSTSPIRILDWLFPWSTFYETSSYLDGGFNLQWWFSKIGGGVVVSFLAFYGWLHLGLKGKITLGGFMAFFIILSLGRYFSPSSYLLTHLPLLRLTRYPERFILYAIPAILFLASLALRGRLRSWGVLLVALAVLENLSSVAHPRLISPAELKVDLPLTKPTPSSLQQARYLLCETGLDGTSTYRSFDVRASEIAMVNGTSNWRSPVFKFLTCPWALKEGVQMFAPYSHVMSSGERLDSPPGLRPVRKIGDGILWEVENARPWSGHWVEKVERSPVVTSIPLKEEDEGRLQKVGEGVVFVERESVPLSSCKGFVDVFPSETYQDFNILTPEPCEGLLVLPLAYHSGWFSDAGEIVRLNDSVLGVIVASKRKNFSVSFRPQFLTPFTLISLIIQLILWVIILGVLSPRKWTRSVREIKQSFNLF